MATFRIHQDLEKENNNHQTKPIEPQQKRLVGAKTAQTRSFGVLSNVSNKVLNNNGKAVSI